MAETPADQAARETTRQREQSRWTQLEEEGRLLRAKQPAQSMSQADKDTSKHAFGVTATA